MLFQSANYLKFFLFFTMWGFLNFFVSPTFDLKVNWKIAVAQKKVCHSFSLGALLKLICHQNLNT